MQGMTEQNLKDALAGESQAHIKYLAFAEQARREGKPNTARLFEAISYSEQAHAIGHLKALGLVGDTAANLKAAHGGETFEIEQMYPAYDSVAQLQGEKGAVRSIHYALEAEKQHQQYYLDTGSLLESGQDRDETGIFVCPICGHTHIGTAAPDRCPVCNARGSSFRSF